MLSILIGLILTKQESWQRSAQARLIYISALYQSLLLGNRSSILRRRKIALLSGRLSR